MPLYIEKSHCNILRTQAVVKAKYANGIFGPRAGTVTISSRPENGAYQIYAVPPRWKGADQQFMDVLKKCYNQSLALAFKNRCGSVSVPLLTSVDFPFSAGADLKIAVDTIRDFLRSHDMRVYLMVPTPDPFSLERRYADLERFLSQKLGDGNISEHRARYMHWDVAQTDFASAYGDFMQPRQGPVHPFPDADQSLSSYIAPEIIYGSAEESWVPSFGETAPADTGKAQWDADIPKCAPAPQKWTAPKPHPPVPAARTSARPQICKDELEEMLREMDSGFSETLLKLIDRSGKKDSEIYSRANISRQHFSKIRNNPDYRPTKATAIAFAIALELDMEQTADLIGRAGYALTQSSKFDLIIMYFIRHRNYNMFDINETLFAYDQSLLGA